MTTSSRIRNGTATVTATPLNLAVIGAGPGDYAGAFLANDLGMKVTLIFRGEHGELFLQRRRNRPMFFIDIAVPQVFSNTMIWAENGIRRAQAGSRHSSRAGAQCRQQNDAASANAQSVMTRRGAVKPVQIPGFDVFFDLARRLHYPKRSRAGKEVRHGRLQQKADRHVQVTLSWRPPRSQP